MYVFFVVHADNNNRVFMGSVRKLKVQSHQILHFILGFVKLNQYFL
jgi:hypothetical protein